MSFATTAAVIGAGAAVASAGVGIAGSLSGGSTPTYRPPDFEPVPNAEFQPVAYDPMQGSEDLLANLPNLIYAANQITRNTMKQIEGIYPGAEAQREYASNTIDQYMAGVVPQDVVDFTNRQVAERSGGSYNANSGAGPAGTQIQGDFGRSLGLTSLQLQQYGMSASQSWQQLAESFTTSPIETGQLALGYADQRYKYDSLNAGLQYQYDALNTQIGFQNQGIAMDVADNVYTSGFNQYQAGQQNTANLIGAGMGAANTIIGAGSLASGQVYKPNTQPTVLNPTLPSIQYSSNGVQNLSYRPTTVPQMYTNPLS